jgi:hypothetical protein
VSDGVVQVAPDSTGKKIDTSELTVNAQTVERQRVNLSDPTVAAALAAVKNADPASNDYALAVRLIAAAVANAYPVKITDGTDTALVDANGSLQVAGYQPAATVQSAITTAVAQTAVATTGLNVVTLSLRTFTGTTPSITFKLQASDDGGTTWYDIQGVNNATGLAGISWTQAAALAAGTGGPSIDYAIGGYTHVRVNVTAISGASATAAFSVAPQTMPYEPTPAAITQGVGAAGSAKVGNPVRVAGSDGTNTQDISVVGKGTQGALGVATQDLKDSGRVNLVFYATNVAAGATGTETAITLTKAADTGATSTGTSFVITNGKRFRITSITFASRGNATATAQVTNHNLRINTGGAVTTASTPLVLQARTATPATASAWDRFSVPIPDGMEFAGNGTIQFGVTMNATYTTNAPTWDVLITGYEY